MGITPDWIVPELTATHVAALHPEPEGSVELSAANVASLRRYNDLKAIVKEANAEMAEIKDHLARALADHEVGTFEGEAVVSWKASKATTTFDVKAFHEEHPDMFETYKVTQPGSRRFLPAKTT
jgi:predicted phage-related endonuclease